MASAAAINERSTLAAKLYSAGMSAEAIGVQLDVDADTVRRDLRRLEVPIRGRGPVRGSPKVVFSVAELVNRRERVRELAGLGMGNVEIARALGVSKTTIAHDRKLVGIASRSVGQPPKSPLPEPRSCEACGVVFTPRRENVKQGGARFCSTACMSRDRRRREASREFVTALNAERGHKIDRLKLDGDLLTRDEAANELHVSPTSIDHYLRQGYLAAIRFDDGPGQPARLIRREDLARFKREWRAAGDEKTLALRSRWLDPDFVVTTYRARGITERAAREHGLTTEDMDAVYRDRVRRRALLFGVRRGRPKGAGPPAYHRQWAEQADFVRAELASHHEEKAELGLLMTDDRPPTDRDVYLAVAERDFALHPERWSGYEHAPGDESALDPRWSKPAIERVRWAVKSLQITASEIR